MKLCLISPSVTVANKVSFYQQLPPMGVAYLASSTREAGHQVQVIDGLGEAIGNYHPFVQGFFIHGLTPEEIVDRVDENVEVIGVSAMLSVNWPLTRRLIVALRERFPYVVLVAGGEHVSATVEYVFESSPIDYAVIGEGEETLLELLVALSLDDNPDVSGIRGLAYRKNPPLATQENGAIACNERRDRRRDLDSIPWPAWDLLPVEAYMDANHFVEVSDRRVMTMLATRGCPHRCRFCSSERMWGTRFFMRDPVDVVDEMESYVERYGATEFQFQDLTFIVNGKWAMRVADEIKSRNMDVVWKLPAGTRSEALTAEVLRKLSESGCNSLSLAPESGSKRILAAMCKKAQPGQFLEIAKMVKRENIDLTMHAYFIIGFPEERLLDVLKTYWWLMRLALVGFDTVSCNKFSCYPGSDYHRVFIEQGKIDYDDDYFLRLDGNIGSLGRGARWHPKWSDRKIGFMTLIGFSIFFGTYYVFSPLKTLKRVIGMLRNKPKTRLERVLVHAVSVRMRSLLKLFQGNSKTRVRGSRSEIRGMAG